jgi:hypothetical protein
MGRYLGRATVEKRVELSGLRHTSLEPSLVNSRRAFRCLSDQHRLLSSASSADRSQRLISFSPPWRRGPTRPDVVGRPKPATPGTASSTDSSAWLSELVADHGESFTCCSRRRKTKCDGVHPRCRYCSARGISCVWPGPAIEPSIHLVPSPDGSDRAHGTVLPDSGPALASVRLPARRVLRRCYDLFSEYHFSDNFCSFLFRPDLEGGLVDSPFLSSSIVCLCSRYFTAEEANEYFGVASGSDVCRLYTPVARAFAKASSDEPSGTCCTPSS